MQIGFVILIAVKGVDAEVVVVRFITGQQLAFLVDLIQQERISTVQVHEIHLELRECLLKLYGYIQRFLFVFVKYAYVQVAILVDDPPDSRSKRQDEPDFVFFTDRFEFLFLFGLDFDHTSCYPVRIEASTAQPSVQTCF